MILVDTSAWVEYLRATGSETHLRLRQLLAEDAALATTEWVVMEVLAGARDERHWLRLRGLLARLDLLAVGGLDAFEAAARLYRRCRARGATVRNLPDCLIAGVALRHNADLLHADSDFNVIARHTELRAYSR